MKKGGLQRNYPIEKRGIDSYHRLLPHINHQKKSKRKYAAKDLAGLLNIFFDKEIKMLMKKYGSK